MENVLSILLDELKAAAESRRRRPISNRAAGCAGLTIRPPMIYDFFWDERITNKEKPRCF